MAIKLIYTIFLALLVSLFVGLGISSFYPGPKAPDYPQTFTNQKEACNCQPTAEEIAAIRAFEQEQKNYMEKEQVYSRNVSIISLIAAIIILVSSLTLLNRIKMIADGILLGGVFTTAYSIMRGLMSEDSQFRFIIVTVGLLIALALGYIKFIRPKEAVS